MPAESATPDDPTDPRTLTLYFASSRAQTRNAGVIALSDRRSPELTFGASRVRVPDEHDEGEVERPREISVFGVTLYKERTDDRKHFVIKATTWLNRGQFVQALNGTRADSALVFVHGFNVTFDEGLYRLAQIVWDTKYKGAPILFSWPSRGGIAAYTRDRESAEFSRPRFVELIRLLQDETSFSAIHVIVHSMGNQVVLDALINPGERPLKPINELILAAPDVDRDIFRGLAARLPRVAKGVTLYVSSKDKAMVASKKFASGPRAGEFGTPPDGLVTAPNMDTIDVTPLGEEMFGLNHNTFAATPSLIGDLHALINGAARPPSTRTKKISGQPEGGPFLFWRHAR